MTPDTYPTDWPQIAAAVKNAAEWRCEHCAAPHDVARKDGATMTNFFQNRFPAEEAAAIHKQPRAGKCPQSEFALGWHRVGLVPYYSVLDGGVPGDSCRWMCLSCGRLWEKEPGAFVLRQQPRRIGEAQP